MKRLILPITALFLSAAPSDINVALPEIIPLNEHISYRVKWESWIVSKEFVRMPETKEIKPPKTDYSKYWSYEKAEPMAKPKPKEPYNIKPVIAPAEVDSFSAQDEDNLLWDTINYQIIEP